ncbi:Os08g0315001 [Oryza sativa Japonica Group]|uniref:Os08g0315001 protein n=1 Tax=Oryza sativa subsp. japonica TaxID=39947 RepID=A0A0P0XEU4_ORYSJ|nr:Os08g0315001 [Oryza sativa Japonica Group]
MLSSKFFKYKLVPWFLSAASLMFFSNFSFNSISLSDFFCALQTYHSLSSNFLPFKSSTARAASSGFSKLTNPKHLDFPSPSRITTTLVMGPNLPKISFKLSSVVDSDRFFTYTLLNLGLPDTFSLSCLRTKGPTYTFLSFKSIPLSLLIAFWAASSSSN